MRVGLRQIIEHVEDLRQAGAERDHVGGQLLVGSLPERFLQDRVLPDLLGSQGGQHAPR